MGKLLLETPGYYRVQMIGVSIAHRTSDIAVFPAAVHDCKTAIRWLRVQAKKYNINPEKIGVTTEEKFSKGHDSLPVKLYSAVGELDEKAVIQPWEEFSAFIGNRK